MNTNLWIVTFYKCIFFFHFIHLCCYNCSFLHPCESTLTFFFFVILFIDSVNKLHFLSQCRIYSESCALRKCLTDLPVLRDTSRHQIRQRKPPVRLFAVNRIKFSGHSIHSSSLHVNNLISSASDLHPYIGMAPRHCGSVTLINFQSGILFT